MDIKERLVLVQSHLTLIRDEAPTQDAVDMVLSMKQVSANLMAEIMLHENAVQTPEMLQSLRLAGV